MAVTITRKAETLIFHKKFTYSDHHRNPSGLHNKVRWLLTTSKYNKTKLTILINRIDIGFPEMDSFKSWSKAFTIARGILDKEFKSLEQTYPEHWRWISSYDRLKFKPEEKKQSALEIAEEIIDAALDIAEDLLDL